MRGIRAIFNKAINEKLIEKEAYPFDQYTIPSKPTKNALLVLIQFRKL
ncbi:MAG: hypothetical protein HWD62_10545 [Cyclobacteriaceae bacterium]|nr:MAG: hypothetical protein HWD62_10545 [Cyclobacteriaceae bacterium]